MNESVTGRQLWRRRCEETPNRTFLYARHRSWTVGDFDVAQRRYAAGFAAVGVGRGQRVAVAMSDGAEALMVLFALQELGAVAVPLRADLPAADLAVRINRSQALCLVADDPAARRLLPRIGDLPQLRTVVSDVTGPCRPDVTCAALAELAHHGPMVPADVPGHCEHDLAMVFSKSSRAGRPTPVALSAGAFCHVGRTFAQQFGIRGYDNLFLPLTIGHSVGALLAPAVATWAGCALTVVPGFSASTFWHQVREHAATVSILFPEHLHLLMGSASAAPEAGQTSLRHVITPVYMDTFQRRFGVQMSTLVCQTEAAAQCGCDGQEPVHGLGAAARKGYEDEERRVSRRSPAQDPRRRIDAEGLAVSTVRDDSVMSGLSDGRALGCACATSMAIGFDRGDRPPRLSTGHQRKVFSA